MKNVVIADNKKDSTPIVYVINGQPLALARPRFTTGVVYNSQKQIMRNKAIDIAQQHDDRPLYDGPLHLDITFYMNAPVAKSVRNRMLGKYHASKPDLSNLIKFVEDIAISVLYLDDRTIVSITAKKVYDLNPRTEFTITELKKS